MRKRFAMQFPLGRTFRRGAAIPLVAVSSVVLMGMAALAIDSGVMYQARTELQAGADAAALAAATEMVFQRTRGQDLTQAIASARNEAAALAARHLIMGQSPTVDPNAANAVDGDVVVGYLSNPDDLRAPLSFAEADRYNTILVRVRRNAIRNGPVDLFFANIFGIGSANMEAQAAAIAEEGARGFNSPDSSGTRPCLLLPFALHIRAWNALLNGTRTNGDHYSYNPTTKLVSAGSDGVLELNIYPGSGTGSQLLTPGEFGTVDIGSPQNSTDDLTRQILYGPNAADFAYLGGKLELGADGTVQLNGEVGLSAAVANDVEFIEGQGRIIPLFNRVTGTGDNSMFSIVEFVGVQIVNVKLTGALKSKEVMIQPCAVQDSNVITGKNTLSHTQVYGPTRLVR